MRYFFTRLAAVKNVRPSARRLAGWALGLGIAASLSACVVPPAEPGYARPAPQIDPRQAALHRSEQVDGRIQNMHRRVDHNMEMGYYPPPVADRLHHQLGDISRESHDMARGHGGGLSREDQALTNRQLDDVGQQIR